MLSFANEIQSGILTELLSLVRRKKITTTDAWNYFTKPTGKLTSTLAGNESFERIFSSKEINEFKNLRMEVRKRLDTRSSRRCSYCRRIKGQHGFSWHIEHVKNKARYPQKMFSMSNLVTACVDCNMTKNNTVDRHNPYVFDIIHPAEPNFSYAAHLKFFQISTEDMHISVYKALSPKGGKTYSKLKFEILERIEVLEGLNPSGDTLSIRLTEAIDTFSSDSDKEELALFLHELKLNIFKK